MKTQKQISLRAALTGLALLGVGVTASADTLTWSGAGDKKSFLEAANWSPAQQPKGGDTLVMGSEVTLAACTFDFGEQGITIKNSAKITSSVVFTGSGLLTKDGPGSFQNTVACTHTGGTLILNGEIYQSARYVNYPLGTGTIEIRRTSTLFPVLNLQNYCSVYSSILVSGPYTANKNTFFENNNPTVYSLITAEDDFIAFCGWSNGTTTGASFMGGISAHGHTARIVNNGNYATTLGGSIDASVSTSVGTTYITRGGGTDPSAKLTIGKGVCQIKADGYWNGTNIVLNASGAELQLTATGNLPAYAQISLVKGAKVSFASVAAVRVAKMTVNGTNLSLGCHTSETDPDWISGSGCLVVGEEEPLPTVLTWTGNAGDRKWGSANNWSPTQVPAPGDWVTFNADVTLEAATVDTGTKGFVLTVGASKTVLSYLTFTGSGKLTKNGFGTYTVYKKSTHSGGCVINDRTLGLRSSHALGTGKVILRAEGGRKPVLNGFSWDPTFTNAISILGKANDYDAIQCSNQLVLQGLIESESDFSAITYYGPLCLTGGVSAPGHTLTYKGNSSFHDYDTVLNGPFNVSLRLQGAFMRTLSCTGTGLDHALTFAAGTNLLNGSFSWQGTNVTVSGAKTLVTVNSSGHFNPEATLKVSDGAKIRFDTATCLSFAHLFVDGKEMPAGVYTKAELPNTLIGGGILSVGQSVAVWKGGTKGNWSTAQNWTTGRVPTAGETVFLPASTTITNGTGAVAIDGDLIVYTGGQVVWSMPLTGKGVLIKRGESELRLVDAKLTHTGGCRIEQGILSMNNTSSPGSGPIWIVRTANVKPQFDLSPAGVNVVLGNDFHILGPASATFDIRLNNDSQLWGEFTAEDDFHINNCWSNFGGGTPFHGKINAPGCAAIFTGHGIQFYETTDGSLDPRITLKDKKFTMADGSKGTNAEATFTAVGTNVFTATATWAGKVVVKNASVVQFNGRNNLSPTSAVTVETGGSIAVAKGVAVHVATLTVNGVVQPEGIYRKNSAPSGSTPGTVFRGEGRFVVGTVGGLILVK